MRQFLPLLLFLTILLGGCALIVQNNFTSENDEYDEIPDPSYEASLPIGMNLHSLNYYTPAPIFTDAMTTAGSMFTFYTDESGSAWNTGMIDEVERDSTGYPTYVPQETSDGHESLIRFLINNYYEGRYRVFWEGDGTLEAGGNRLEEDELGYYIDLLGTGGNTWLNITYSNVDDPLRNIRIIPEDYEMYSYDDYDPEGFPTFLASYLEGLEEFHALRFMDWVCTNGSDQVDWGDGSDNNATPDDYTDDRITTDYFSQGTYQGISFDYAIELCNELQVDAWVCIPHMASDDYITNLAELWRDNLDDGLKIYLEFSNEMWNWNFVQAQWVLYNGSYSDYPEPVDDYVVTQLEALGEAGEGHPEKDAFMMARAFYLWDEVFGSEMEERVVKVATGQHAWYDNSNRILSYLFDESEYYGAIGCDALSVGGYFGFSYDNHVEWEELGDDLSFQQIYYDTYQYFLESTIEWTEESAAYATEYGIDYYVYEGGQHMQPYNQSEWDYNQQLWDFQIDERMYELYMHNFDLHVQDNVNCGLFMAFSYIGTRESKYGSWGHLETLDQIGGTYSDAPKYQALLDVNSD
ncbi:MAG: hypothetical protein PQJ59_14415 [Spirochaetales bacterium]|nr:hypothetical protein [Spirochaetales bacterium]